MPRTMLKLLKEVDVPGIKVMHGVCVCGPKHYDWDLATQSGAVQFVQVVEGVKQITRSSLTILDGPKFKSNRHSDSRKWSRLPKVFRCDGKVEHMLPRCKSE